MNLKGVKANTEKSFISEAIVQIKKNESPLTSEEYLSEYGEECFLPNTNKTKYDRKDYKFKATEKNKNYKFVLMKYTDIVDNLDVIASESINNIFLEKE